jgi:HK97 gp10 family phage protein
MIAAMARRHVARKGGIADFRSALPKIAAELPLRTFEVVMQVANDTVAGAIQRSSAQYKGGPNPFNLEVREVHGEATEARGGKERSGAWVSGWTIDTGGPGKGAHVTHQRAAGIYGDWYWFFGEFGTSHEPARPFMIPALQEAYTRVHPHAARAFANLPKAK